MVKIQTSSCENSCILDQFISSLSISDALGSFVEVIWFYWHTNLCICYTTVTGLSKFIVCFEKSTNILTTSSFSKSFSYFVQFRLHVNLRIGFHFLPNDVEYYQGCHLTLNFLVNKHIFFTHFSQMFF